MSTQIGAVARETGTVLVTDAASAALVELDALIYGHPELFPLGHTPNYFRKQLRGEKPMSLEAFTRTLDKIVRRHGEAGREMVRRVLDQMFARYSFHAADGEGVAPSTKSLEEELLEYQLAESRFVIAVTEANTTGDPSARRSAKRAGDRCIKELRDVQRAVSA